MSSYLDHLAFHHEPAPERGKTLLSLELPSDLNLKYAYILRVMEVLRSRWPFSAEYQKNIELCIDEAIKNSIEWGNRSDPRKKVRLRVWEEEGRWGLTLSDQGDGFTAESLPNYESEEFLWQERGRGIYILLNYLGEVSYYDRGRTLLLRS